MTISSIGSGGGRTYSTLQAWENACPANLVTSTDTWEGECYNDSEFTSATTLLTISGITTNATYYVTLRCATGQSFRDNAGVRSNALDYAQANGVALRTSGNYYYVIDCSVAYTRFEDLQLKDDGSGNASAVALNLSADFMRVTNCILDAARHCLVANGTGSDGNNVYYNCLFIGSGNFSLTNIGRTGAQGATMIGCTIVKTGTAAGTGITMSNYSTYTVKDCAVFNVTTFSSGGSGATAGSGYNATDLGTAFGSTGNQVSKTFANQFESTSNDFRAKAGGDLINNGNTDSNIDPDISGTARSGTPTIGCWEYVSSGGSSRPVKMAGYWAGYAGNSGGFAGDD